MVKTIKQLLKDNKSKRTDRINLHIDNLGTLHSITVDGKTPKDATRQMLDKVITLSRSTLARKLEIQIDKFMKAYYEMPEDEQVRPIPKSIVKFRTAVGRELKALQFEQRNYTNKTPRPPMLINDENDTVKHIIPKTILQVADVEIDFPYKSTKDIIADKNLNWQQKSKLIDDYLKAKDEAISNESIVEEVARTEVVKPTKKVDIRALIDKMADDPNIQEKYDDWMETQEDEEVVEETEEVVEDDDDKLVWEDDEVVEDDGEIIQSDVAEIMNEPTPYKRYLKLCEKYPKNFMKAEKGIGKRVGVIRTYRGKKYKPTFISLIEKEAQEYIKKVKIDSTTMFLQNTYYIKQLKQPIYFIRTNKE